LNTAKVQIRLGQLLIANCNPNEAIQLTEKGLETRKRYFPSDSQEISSAVFQLAQACIANNEPQRAEAVIATLQQEVSETAGAFAPGQQAMR
jgi:hypothetical protein